MGQGEEEVLASISAVHLELLGSWTGRAVRAVPEAQGSSRVMGQSWRSKCEG